MNLSSYRMHVLYVPDVDPLRDDNVACLKTAGACIHVDHTPKKPGHKRPIGGLVPMTREMMTCAKSDGTAWSLMLHDDAYPLPGWSIHLPLALRYSPAEILACLHLAGVGAEAARKGYAYGLGYRNVWGAAMAYRSHLLQPILDFYDLALQILPEYGVEDWLVRAWSDWKRIPTAFTSRAIFDHGPPNQIPRSLLGHAGAARKPDLTIMEPGPRWSTPGAARSSGTAVLPELMERLRELE